MTRWLAALTLVTAAATAADAAGRRFVLAVGENAGDPSQPELKFTHDDARSVVDVMTELGGVRADDVVLVTGTSADELRVTLAAVRLRLTMPGFDELVVYVSSHAAEGSLRLRGTRFPLTELRRFVDEVPVPVVTVVLDVCQAGQLVREKGLEPVKRSVTVEPAGVRGRVFIMSSGATEAAQESDGVQGSTFTHNLVAGLRGPADVSRDRQVTLHEAFAYAHDRTLEATFGAPGGTQTPRFDIALRGQRELVLTELAQSAGRITIAVAVPGEWLVVPIGGARRATHFVKGSGPVELALAPGAYRLATIDGDMQREGTVVVSANRELIVVESDLAGWARVSLRNKGGVVGWTIELGPQLGTPTVTGVGTLNGGVVLALSLADVGWIGPRTWYELALGVRFGAAAASLGSFDQREVELGVGLGPEWPLGSWRLRVGLTLGGVVAIQSGELLTTRVALLPRVGLLGEATVGLSAPFYLGLRVHGGGQWVATQGGDGLRDWASMMLMLGAAL